MAIAGSWAAGAVTPSEYAGATRWGTGYNPIHAVRDAGSRETGIKANLLPLGDGSYSGTPDELLAAEQWGYSPEDAAAYAGEDYRYLTDDHPNWGDGTTGRTDRDGQVMRTGQYPQPEGWPEWGPHFDDNPVDGFPLAGPTGGGGVRAYSDGAEIENAHAIAVPTPGWRGGWLNKAHGIVQESEGADPSQLTINTGDNQLHRSRDNNRAAARGTDDPRQPIATRLTGMKVKHYAKSSGMGGGPATPDMKPVTQNLPYRPWFYRSGAMPPPPDTTYGTMTSFEPIERTLPVDAGEYVTTQEAPPDDGTYGYAGGDYVG